jgi:hypothetical protein
MVVLVGKTPALQAGVMGSSPIRSSSVGFLFLVFMGLILAPSER